MASTSGDFTVAPTARGPGSLDCSLLTLRSYAFDLLDWFRFLAVAGAGWQHATRAHVRDWVLRQRSQPNPQRPCGVGDRAALGAGNLPSGTPSRRDGYAPATINHRLSVVAGFYQHHAHLGNGPATNPVPDDGPRGSRRNAHHNPMEPWTPGPRGSYRQKAQQRLPRAPPDELYERVPRGPSRRSARRRARVTRTCVAPPRRGLVHRCGPWSFSQPLRAEDTTRPGCVVQRQQPP